jgi:hypothetical protein
LPKHAAQPLSPDALFLVAFLDVLGFAFLLVSVGRFVTARHEPPASVRAEVHDLQHPFPATRNEESKYLFPGGLEQR